MVRILLCLFCCQKFLKLYHFNHKYNLILNINDDIVNRKSEFEIKLALFFCDRLERNLVVEVNYRLSCSNFVTEGKV